MDSSIRNGGWIKLHLIFKGGGPSSFVGWSFKCWTYLKNQPHCVMSWASEVSNHNWSLGHWELWSQCTQLYRQGSVSWISLPTEKGMLYNTFQTKQYRSHQLQICFENSQPPGGSQLLLLETITLSHRTPDSPFAGPSTATHKTYAVPPILEAWDTIKANKELSEASVVTPYIRNPSQEGTSWAHESCPW